MAGKIPLIMCICIYIQVFLGHMNLLHLFNIQLHWTILSVIHNIAVLITYMYPAVAHMLGWSPLDDYACGVVNFVIIAYAWTAVLEFILMFYACTFSNALQTVLQKIIELKARVKADGMTPYGFSTKQMLCFILLLAVVCSTIAVIHIYRTCDNFMNLVSMAPDYRKNYALDTFPTMSPIAAVFTYYLLLFVQAVFPVIIWCNIILYISLIYYVSQELHRFHK